MKYSKKITFLKKKMKYSTILLAYIFIILCQEIERQSIMRHMSFFKSDK